MTSQEDGSRAAPADRGLANERTALAWIRSTLALLGVGLIVARIAYPAHPVLGTILAGASLAVAASVLRSATLRYRHAASALASGRHPPPPDGRLPATLTLLTAMIGLVGLVFVVLS